MRIVYKPRTDKKEATGANRRCSDDLRREQWSSEKRKIFLHGEVFFLLTGPLMGVYEKVNQEKILIH